MRAISMVLWGAVILTGIYLVLNAPQTNQVIMQLGTQASGFFRTLQGR